MQAVLLHQAACPRTDEDELYTLMQDLWSEHKDHQTVFVDPAIKEIHVAAELHIGRNVDIDASYHIMPEITQFCQYLHFTNFAGKKKKSLHIPKKNCNIIVTLSPNHIFTSLGRLHYYTLSPSPPPTYCPSLHPLTTSPPYYPTADGSNWASWKHFNFFLRAFWCSMPDSGFPQVGTTTFSRYLWIYFILFTFPGFTFIIMITMRKWAYLSFSITSVS